MNRLRGKVALITGGTSGIGAATAKLFQEEGACVIVTGSSDKNSADARSRMANIEVITSDASDPAASKALVDQIREKHGRLDVFHINAGVVKVAKSEDVDEKMFDSVFNVNVRGAYFLLKHAIGIISDGGSVILTSSTGAVQGYPGLGVYNATKAAIRSFGRTFAVELAPRRIRVNCILPGSVDTGITSKMALTPEQEKGFAALIEQTPLRRSATPEEIAAAALYFASDDSQFTTGAELVVDGGSLAI